MFRKNLFVLVMGLIAVTLCSPLLAQQKTEKKIFRRITPKGQVKSVKIGGRDWGVRKINSVHDLLSVKQLNKRNFGKELTIPENQVNNGIQNKKPEKIYENLSFNNDSPYINAESVDNRSVFEANSIGDMPYHFYNTKYFTNYGVFRVRDNFDFRTYETYETFLGEIDVEPRSAKVFENKQGGIIESRAPEIVNSYIRIHADEFKNQGKILGANAAFIELIGDKMSLKNGVIAISGGKSYDFFNDISGNGFYWGEFGFYQGHRLYNVGATAPFDYIYGRTKPSRHVFAPQYGVINVFSGVMETVGGAIGWAAADPDSGGYATVGGIGTSVIEIGSKYSILGMYSEPYGGEYGWVTSPGGSQFTPYVWEDFYSTGDNEFTHVAQAVFVRNTGAQQDIEYEARIFPYISSNEDGADDLELWTFGSPVVEFKTKKGFTNEVEGAEQINSIYVIDETQSNEAKWNFNITNIFSIPVTEYMQPDSYTFTRYTPREFQEGEEPNSSLGVFDLYFYESAQGAGEGHRAAAGVRFTNIISRVETETLNFWNRKGFGSTNLVTQPMMNAGMITNFPWYGRSETPLPILDGVMKLDQPGSVELISEELDLTQARIRAEGGVTIETEHLIGTSNLVVDCQNIILRLGRKYGNLLVTNIVPDSVQRFTGHIEVHSSAWNQGVDSFGGENGPNIKSKYYATFVDANIQVTNRVVVPEARFKSPEKIIIGDPIEITDKLRVYGNELEIHKKFKLGFDGEGQVDWDKDVAPDLLSIKIFGNLEIPNNQYFGNDRERRYETWYNAGTNSAYVTKIHSKNFINEGIMSALQNITVKADSIKIENAFTESHDVMTFESLNAKFRNQTNIIHGKFLLDVRNNLTDGGSDADNYIRLWNDLEIVSLPEVSDLLGTTIHAISTNYANRIIKWPAKDYGAREIGYENNLGLGTLILTNGFRGTITFSGNNNEKNALYVDHIEFENRKESDLYDKDILINSFPEIFISDNFTIYFASSNLPEEKLDGMYGGRLRWVKEFPGYKSSMPLYLLGLKKTIKVNKPYRQSLIYDADGDGIANGFDLTPFGAGLPELLNFNRDYGSKGAIIFDWLAIPNTVYYIEYKSDISESKWRLHSKIDYNEMSTRAYRFKDVFSKKSLHKFFRLRVAE